MSSKTNLDLINECDNFPYFQDSSEVYEKVLSDYYEFHVRDKSGVLGYIPSSVVENMPWSDIWALDKEARHVTLQVQDSAKSADESRSSAIASFLTVVREQNTFRVIDGWRNEVYPIFGKSREFLLSMERSATPLFGVVTYGVHMTAYVRSEHGIEIWAPRRSKTKQTYPGMMDNTVAGGLSTGEQPFDCLVREAQEEASLPEEIVRESAKGCGSVTYFHVRDARAGGETGLCQPECQYVYDLELPDTVVPQPCDNEAVDFRLLAVEDVQKAMADGEFKPNCALILLDFFIRHGIITPETEPDYIEIVARLHRRLEFPTA